MVAEPITVLIADDNAPFRQGLRDLLRSVDNVAVIAEAGTGEEAVVRAGVSQPDVVLMDLKMPVLNGIEGAARIVATSPHIAVLMLSMFEDDDSIMAAMRAGARGYLLKGASRAEIVRALLVAREGGLIFGPGVARRMLEHFATTNEIVPQPFPQLSARERQILTSVAEGKGNADIASDLRLSHKTVRNHLYSIYQKLQVQSRAAAVVRAREAGLGALEQRRQP